MASTSSSASIPPPPRSCTYHVFLSFRGEDTRKSFTGHLYAALNRKGITTYKDDKNLRKGDVISKELLKAIEESMFAVIVFSPDYAFSRWCLDELQKIMECNSKLGQHIVPVFYGVEPCDVRHQRGIFKEAFKKHQQRHDRKKVKRWRDALTQIAAHSGWTSKIYEDEAVLVENIAQHIFEILIPKFPSSMKNLVGIESRVEQAITLIGLELNDVRFIGIWGMGGMGKTTIARAVFETIQSRFEVTCFLADVREQCEKKDITDIQKQLLKQMNISSNAVHNKYDGRTIIQNSLRLKKVLLVLDDVNHEKQLEDLAGQQDWFGPGSRIIITTRDVEVLKGPGVHETYKVEGLVKSEAFNLFCLKAFKQEEPTEGFLDLSEEVVKYSGGLPLALKVLGSYLYGRSIAVWHSAIEKIKKSSHSEIIDALKISYEGLDDMEKNIFLDIACFFKGYMKDDVTRILEGCGYQAEIGLDILINRSLVIIKYAQLGMHDLLEEMGKQIVIQKSPNDACKRSRLWCLEDVEFVLTQNKKTKATHGIVLHKLYSETEVNRRDLSFSKMWQLKLLILDGVTAPILYDIPCTLKIFRWFSCPLKTLPLTDHQRYELVEIDLTYGEIVELWDGKKVLEKLEHLDLSKCKQLKQMADISGVPNLKKLNLRECEELDYIHPSLAHHKRLVELNLSYCERLETLGDKLEMSALEILDLSCCSSLRRLPDVSGVPNLKKLDLSICNELDYIHPSLAHHKRLVELNLSYCESLETLGDKLEMSSLEKLHLSWCSSLRRLPEFGECMKQFTSLRELHAQGCDSLDASNVDDVISKACCGFAESASQDREDFLQMLIPGKEIPAWFEHQEEDDGVSVSFPLNRPSTEMVALALCFLVERDSTFEFDVQASVICNGKEFINASFSEWGSEDNLFIVCVNGYSFSKLLCQRNRFQFQKLFPDPDDDDDDDYLDFRVSRCGARWVCKQDIQHFKKRKYETGKRKATLELNTDMISHSSASTNKTLVVDSPLYEQEIERAATAEGAIRHLASRKSSDLHLFPLHPSSHSS